MATHKNEKNEPVDELKDGPGVSHPNPRDPAYPMYKVLETMRHPLTLRDAMISPVRAGYIGQDHTQDESLLPASGKDLFPEIEVKDLFIPSTDGPIHCIVYRSPQTPDHSPIMLYAHGGGFMVGKSADTDFITRKIAALNQLIIVSVNYRLAPEFPFPIGVNDFYTCYCWLQGHGQEIGGNAEQIVVSGDSSGSNFAAVIPLKAKEDNRQAPSAVVLLGPLLDMYFENYDSFNKLAPLGIVYDTAFMGFARGAYTPKPDFWGHPYVSPYFGDLTDYPSIMLVVGTEDPLVDSTKAFAEKHRKESSNECMLLVCQGMPHGFYFFPNLFKEENQAYLDMRDFLMRNLRLSTIPTT